MRSASRSVIAPSQQTRTPPSAALRVCAACENPGAHSSGKEPASKVARSSLRSPPCAAFDFLRQENQLHQQILVFEFQMKKDGERGIGESSRARRREPALLRVAHPPTSVSGLNADDISRVVERSHVSPGARVRSFVASVRDHTGCQPRNSSGLPWRVLQSVSEARLRPGACVKDGR